MDNTVFVLLTYALKIVAVQEIKNLDKEAKLPRKRLLEEIDTSNDGGSSSSSVAGAVNSLSSVSSLMGKKQKVG